MAAELSARSRLPAARLHPSFRSAAGLHRAPPTSGRAVLGQERCSFAFPRLRKRRSVKGLLEGGCSAVTQERRACLRHRGVRALHFLKINARRAFCRGAGAPSRNRPGARLGLLRRVCGVDERAATLPQGLLALPAALSYSRARTPLQTTSSVPARAPSPARARNLLVSICKARARPASSNLLLFPDRSELHPRTPLDHVGGRRSPRARCLDHAAAGVVQAQIQARTRRAASRSSFCLRSTSGSVSIAHH